MKINKTTAFSSEEETPLMTSKFVLYIKELSCFRKIFIENYYTVSLGVELSSYIPFIRCIPPFSDACLPMQT
jgi:hypothetical protein